MKYISLYTCLLWFSWNLTYSLQYESQKSQDSILQLAYIHSEKDPFSLTTWWKKLYYNSILLSAYIISRDLLLYCEIEHLQKKISIVGKLGNPLTSIIEKNKHIFCGPSKSMTAHTYSGLSNSSNQSGNQMVNIPVAILCHKDDLFLINLPKHHGEHTFQ